MKRPEEQSTEEQLPNKVKSVAQIRPTGPNHLLGFHTPIESNLEGTDKGCQIEQTSVQF